MSVFCSNWVIHPDAGIWSNLKSIKTDHPSSLFNKSQSHLIQLFFRFEVNVKWIFEHPIYPEENNQRFVPHLQSLLLTNLKDQGCGGWRIVATSGVWRQSFMAKDHLPLFLNACCLWDDISSRPENLKIYEMIEQSKKHLRLKKKDLFVVGKSSQKKTAPNQNPPPKRLWYLLVCTLPEIQHRYQTIDTNCHF